VRSDEWRVNNDEIKNEKLRMMELVKDKGTKGLRD
jgi:hypothetical protein